MPKDMGAKGPKAGVSCGVCDDLDNSRMVCCDECDRWFHFACVGVDEDIKEVDWSCSTCNAGRTSQGTSGLTTKPAQVQADHVSKGIQEQQNEQLKVLQKTMDQLQGRFEKQQQAYEKLLQEKDREMQNTVAELHRQFERRMEQREQQIRNELSVPAVVPPPIVDVTPVPVVASPPNANSTKIVTTDRAAEDIYKAIERMERQLEEMVKKQDLQTNRLEERLKVIEIGNNKPVHRSGSLNVDADPFNPYHRSHIPSANLSYELTNSQLAARHAVSKELPIFSGDPEEWPLFIATYDSTTRMCGFSEEENLLRLQRSLKGKALEAVRSRLLYPAGLEGVINTLRMLFGRPEVIVHSLANKIREMPSPKTEKLGTLIDFGVAVQNMCATILACGLNDHLCNVALLQELVDRLPPTVKLDWAKHRQTLSAVTLSNFSEWLGELVEAACVVTVPSSIGSYASYTEKRGRKEQVHVHLETNSDTASSSGISFRAVSKQTNKQCVICEGECRNVGLCPTFQSMNIGARWTTLRENKLCRKCLTKHFGACTVKQACGRNGCTFMHHELLHDDSRYQRRENTPTTTNVENSVENCNTH